MKHLLKSVGLLIFLVYVVPLFADNLLINSDFSKETGWSYFVSKSVQDAGGGVVLREGKGIIKCPAMENISPYDIQIIKAIDVDAGRNFILKLKINTEKAGELKVSYGSNKPPFTSYAGASVSLAAGEKEYECKLWVRKDKDGNYEEPRALRLVLGGFKDTTLILSEISLEEVR